MYNRRMIKFTYVGAEKSLKNAVLENYDRMSYASLQKILRKKDVKVNGVRISSSIEVKSGDIIEIYADDSVISGEVPIVASYEDNNILVVHKPTNIEVTSLDNKTDLEFFVNKYLAEKKQVGQACHRLDRNTSGLVIFAKNQAAYEEVYDTLKKHKLEKYYLAIVYGNFTKPTDTLSAYLVKDKISSMSYVSASKKEGGELITTKYTVLKEKKGFSLVEVELITGKTHQIRAHMAYINHSVVGDSKYSPREKFVACKFKNQLLWAYKIKFNFLGQLAYLKDQVVQIDTEEINNIFNSL